MSREAIGQRLNDVQRKWVDDLFTENDRLRNALREIAELDEPISPPGALRQCDYLKGLARDALNAEPLLEENNQ